MRHGRQSKTTPFLRSASTQPCQHLTEPPVKDDIHIKIDGGVEDEQSFLDDEVILEHGFVEIEFSGGDDGGDHVGRLAHKEDADDHHQVQGDAGVRLAPAAPTSTSSGPTGAGGDLGVVHAVG